MPEQLHNLLNMAMWWQRLIIVACMAHLVITKTTTDGDFVATLQDVAPDGAVSSYNVQGELRASMRQLAESPYNHLGLPYHSFKEADVSSLVPGEPIVERE